MDDIFLRVHRHTFFWEGRVVTPPTIAVVVKTCHRRPWQPASGCLSGNAASSVLSRGPGMRVRATQGSRTEQEEGDVWSVAHANTSRRSSPHRCDPVSLPTPRLMRRVSLGSEGDPSKRQKNQHPFQNTSGSFSPRMEMMASGGGGGLVCA